MKRLFPLLVFFSSILAFSQQKLSLKPLLENVNCSSKTCFDKSMKALDFCYDNKLKGSGFETHKYVSCNLISLESDKALKTKDVALFTLKGSGFHSMTLTSYSKSFQESIDGQLSSLKFEPITEGGDPSVDGQLSSLKYSGTGDSEIDGQLSSLKFAPVEVEGGGASVDGQLSSLKFTPVESDFDLKQEKKLYYSKNYPDVIVGVKKSNYNKGKVKLTFTEVTVTQSE